MISLIIIILIVILIQIQSFLYHHHHHHHHHHHSLRLYMNTKQARAITYSSIDIFNTKILVKDNDNKDTIIDIINKWDNKSKVDEVQLQQWEESGIVIILLLLLLLLLPLLLLALLPLLLPLLLSL